MLRSRLALSVAVPQLVLVRRMKHVFRDHRFAFSFSAINTFIVVEEMARLYLSHPKFVGLGWYWTAALSFPCSLVLYILHWPWSYEFFSLMILLLVGAFQWGIIGPIMDRNSRARHLTKR